MTVRTRFAPSPTGYLHIGGVRTALFNWLYARRHGGRFILRIDDTDRARNLDAALAPILHGFRWLGLDWDEGPAPAEASGQTAGTGAAAGGDGAGATPAQVGEKGPYFQSEKLSRYQEIADRLIASGHAYRDYATTEELAAERETAQKEKRRFVYSRTWMAATDAQRAEYEAQGRPGVVRLKMPREGQCTFTDRIRGDVAVDWAGEQDHVIQRADGTCLYHLASVVDDHDMEITHVIRAEEHLSNTPRQIFIFDSLGWARPEFAHLPVVAEPGSRTKLSKRKLEKYLKNPDFASLNQRGQAIAAAVGLSTAAETFNPVIVDFYEQVGFLPHALVNYLLLLGWSLDDHTEDLTREEMIRHFGLERVNRAPASFDPARLLSFQERAMLALPVAGRVEMTLPYLVQAGLISGAPDDAVRAQVAAIVEAAGDRIKVAGDILDYADFFTADSELAMDEAAFEKRLRKPDDAAVLLAAAREHLAGLASFDAAAVEAALREFLEARDLKMGAIVHALRVAATGKAVGFGLFETLAILGRDRTLARLDRALARLR